jgi:hypothetical protein
MVGETQAVDMQQQRVDLLRRIVTPESLAEAVAHREVEQRIAPIIGMATRLDMRDEIAAQLEFHAEQLRTEVKESNK